MTKFKKWDELILKKYPMLWIWGVHIYIPLALLSMLLMFLGGFFVSLEVLPPLRELRSSAGTKETISIVVILILLVFFFIRQIKFNSLRVHHSVPYKNPFLHYLVFFVTIFLITAIPFSYRYGIYQNLKLRLDEEEFISDLAILDAGYSHVLQGRSSDSYYYGYDDDLKKRGTYRNLCTYRTNEYQDSLILKRDSYVRLGGSIGSRFQDYSASKKYVRHINWDTISMSKAIAEIKAFQKVAPKYLGRTKYEEARPLLSDHLEYAKSNFSSGKYITYDALNDSQAFRNVGQLHEEVLLDGNFFFNLKWDFWKYYLILPMSLSLLLYVICAARIRDFGWSMLIVSLTMVLFSILFGLLNFSGSGNMVGVTGIGLIMIFLLFYLIIIFGEISRPTIKRSFGVALQLLLPVVIFLLFVFFDESHRYDYSLPSPHNQEYFSKDGYYDFAYLFTVVASLIGLGVFNRFYTRKYIHPVV